MGVNESVVDSSVEWWALIDIRLKATSGSWHSATDCPCSLGPNMSFIYLRLGTVSGRLCLIPNQMAQVQINKVANTTFYLF